MPVTILFTPNFSQDEHDSLARLPQSYTEAIKAAGALPLIAADADPVEYARVFDGLVLTGGADINPALYGQTAIPQTQGINHALDQLEIGLYHAFVQAGKPVLGICRGIQLVNVAAGGSLWQDLPSQQGLTGHAYVKPLTSHLIRTEADSWLGRLFGSEFLTNSYHHQAVRQLAPGFIASAWSDDDVVEAIRHEQLPVLAVQWHPERMTGSLRPASLPDMLPLFKYWVDLCRKLK